jgi:hypothetical protein
LPICICGQVALLSAKEPPTECERAGTEVRPAKQGGSGVTEAAEEGCGARQDGQDDEAEAEEEDRAREVAAAGGPTERRVQCGVQQSLFRL